MKKKVHFFILIAVITVFGAFISTVFYPKEIKASNGYDVLMQFKVGQKEYLLNGMNKTMDAEPVLMNDRTMIPIRFVVEPMGAVINWNNDEQKVTIDLNGKNIELWIGKNNANVNGVLKEIYPGEPMVKPVLIKDRTMLPIRFVAETLGAEVEWEDKTQGITIKYNSANNSGFSSVNVLRVEKIDGVPTAFLSNGKKVKLYSIDDIEKYNYWAVAPLDDVPKVVTDKLNSDTPLKYDMFKWQTSVKDQSERALGTSFAVIAAMEARYKRMNSSKFENIDLSEQFANYIQKMAYLEKDETSSALYRENSLGCWGGSGLLYFLTLFGNVYSIPQESYFKYVTDSSYENTNELTDSIRIDVKDDSITQKLVDDINFSQSNLPVYAIINAKYGIKNYCLIPYDKLTDTKYFEAVLSSDYEIIMDYIVGTPDPIPENGVSDPGMGTGAIHTILLVGYDKNRQVFYAKNSWGLDNGNINGYMQLSYNYVKRGYVKSAAYITDVTSEDDYHKNQLYIGRWDAEFNGVKGTLDIYRIVGLKKDIEGKKVENRLGTFFMNGTTPYRVNGYLEDNKIIMYIDFSNPELGYNELIGNKIEARLSADYSQLTGTCTGTDEKLVNFNAKRK